MSNDKHPIEDVAAIVESEGLGYAIMHYMDSGSIADKKLAALWDEAKELLNEIDSLLKPYYSEDEGDDE